MTVDGRRWAILTCGVVIATAMFWLVAKPSEAQDWSGGIQAIGSIAAIIASAFIAIQAREHSIYEARRSEATARADRLGVIVAALDTALRKAGYTRKLLGTSPGAMGWDNYIAEVTDANAAIQRIGQVPFDMFSSHGAFMTVEKFRDVMGDAANAMTQLALRRGNLVIERDDLDRLDHCLTIANELRDALADDWRVLRMSAGLAVA